MFFSLVFSLFFPCEFFWDKIFEHFWVFHGFPWRFSRVLDKISVVLFHSSLANRDFAVSTSTIHSRSFYPSSFDPAIFQVLPNAELQKHPRKQKGDQ